MSVTAVTLGSFYTTGSGKTVLGGAGGSGLDTQSLITALTTAKQAPITLDQTLIKANDAKSSAFNQLQTLLSTFKSAADALRNQGGATNAANNAFKFTTASVGNGGSSYVSVLSSAGASLQSYNISDISSMATSATQGTGTFVFADANADATTGAVRFNPGTITFAGGATVTIASGDSLNTVVANFNAVSDHTGINASIIQIDSTHYQISFSSTATGSDASFDLSGATVTGGAAVLSNLGLTAANAGTNAVFKINGVQIERQSNTITDAVTNLTFKILGTTPDGVTNYPVNITPDYTTVQNSIVNLITAYNAIRTFQVQQTQLNADGTYADTAVLVNDPTFQSLMNNVNRSVNSAISGLTASDPATLSDIGITFTNQPADSTTPEVDNIMTVDDSKLASALTSNFNGIRDMFGLNLTSSNPNFALYSHTLPINVSDFTLDANTVTKTFTVTYHIGSHAYTTDLSAEPLTGGVPGYKLTGALGSPLEGATFLYTTNSSSTVTAHLIEGIADRAYTTATNALTPKTGSLAVALQALKDSDAKLNDDISKINADVATYQQTLVAKFAALEQAISSANTLLQSISANSDAALVASGR